MWFFCVFCSGGFNSCGSVRCRESSQSAPWISCSVWGPSLQEDVEMLKWGCWEGPGNKAEQRLREPGLLRLRRRMPRGGLAAPYSYWEEAVAWQCPSLPSGGEEMVSNVALGSLGQWWNLCPGRCFRAVWMRWLDWMLEVFSNLGDPMSLLPRLWDSCSLAVNSTAWSKGAEPCSKRWKRWKYHVFH